MPSAMSLRYAITDRRAFSGDGAAQIRALVACAAVWAEDGVDFVQLREKDLPETDLKLLAKQMRSAVGDRVRLLVNAGSEAALRVAEGSGADGVHVPLRELAGLRASISAGVWSRGPEPAVSVSCHSLAEVREAARWGVDVVLFGPAFEKRVGGEVVRAGVGVEVLGQAAALMPGRVLALGGVTAENAAVCLAAGAAGVAGIRLFAGLCGGVRSEMEALAL